MAGVIANGLDHHSVVADDDTGSIPFTPAVPMRDSQEHADCFVLAWILLLYRNSAESTFTSGISSTVDGESSRTPTASGFAAEFVSQIHDPVSAVLERIRARSVQPPSAAAWDGQSMFFSNAGSLAEQDAESSLHMDTRVSDGQVWVRQTRRPPVSRHMAMFQVYAYVDILNAVLADRSQTVAQAIQLRERELAQLWQWNTPLAPRIDRCMHELFAEQARLDPDRVAVVSWDGQLTYGELDELSSRLAGRLAALGAGVGVIIPLCFEKSKWTSVALIAVMKTGSAFSLTDPSQPEARLRVIAEEVGARMVLTSESKAELGAQIAPDGAAVVAVGAQLLQDTESSGWKPAAVPPSATLYVIFTSGSTGKPKGIEISHSNYTSGAVPRGDIVGYRPHSRVLDFASYAFDVSIDCMLCTLATGGVICVPSEEQRMNDLGGAIRSMDANMAHMTPSVARVLDPDTMSSLEVIGLGGEAVSARDAAAWSERTRPVICYGPSECTVGCTVNGDVAPGRTSIGRGVGGATWICDPDDHDRLMPVGAVGELLVEGPLVGKGYLNQPDKTAEVFVEDLPWLLAGLDSAGAPGRRGRLYKTGDLVRYDPDGSGNIVFVGRKDAQVKLRGQRVELGEVEYHVQSHLPAGTGVAAEVVKPAGGEPTLVAFVAANSSPPSFAPELRRAIAALDQALAKELPIYMLPSAYIPLERIPTLVSLKTDRKRLRELGAALSRQQLAKLRAATAGEQREPRTPMERTLHRLWTALFGSDTQVGLDSNFFGLGGDSLAAMRLVAAARKEGLSLTVASIFTHPRLVDMAAVVGSLDDAREAVAAFSLLPQGWDAGAARSSTAELCGVAPGLVEDAYPCTPLQEGLMALSAKVKSAYVAQRVVALPDLLTAHRLRDAFNAAAADCPILRTRIVQVPGRGLVQVVVRGDMPWTASTSIERYIAQDQEDEMGLGTALARLGMAVDDATGAVSFVLTIHHALYDGWAMPLVVERVNRAYQGLGTARLAPFRAFIHHLTTIDHEVSRGYWRETLDGAGRPQFPALPFPGYQTKADSLLERYVTLPKRAASNTTIATAIRGAWALVAAQYTSDDVVFGETLTGRNANIVGVEDIEGPMITTVPLRVRIDPRARAADYLQAIHRDTVSRIPHEHLGLQNIRRLHPDAREACELRTGLVMHPTAEPEDFKPRSDDEPALGFMPANDLEAAAEALKFNSYALMLVCSLEPHGFLIMASFDQNTLSVARAEKVLEQFEHTVQRLCEDGQVLIGDIDCVTQPGFYAEHRHPNGLVIPPPKLEQPRRDSAMHSPIATEKQQKLRSLWSRVLGISEEEIDADANFFELGGDSIAAMKLVSEARLEGLRLTVADMFKNRYLLDMADVVQVTESQLSPSSKTYTPFSLLDAPLQAIKPALENPDWNVVDVLPARPLQEIAVQGTTTLPRFSARYELMYLDAAIDKRRLFASCQELVARNEILRTVFVECEARCYGVVLEKLQVPIVEYRTDAGLPAFAEKLCNLDVETLMPLGSSFVKFFFIQGASDQSCLIMRISHAQYDEMCLPALLRQLSALYEGKPVADSIPFSSFVHHVLKENIPASTQYWRDLLKGSSMTVLQPKTPLVSKQSIFIQKKVDISARSKETTIATLPTAAWALCLARRLSIRDVTFGEVVTGRNIDFANADKVMGPCWQYVPTRVKFEPGWTALDLLDSVQQQHIASAAHEGMGLKEIVQNCTDWPQTIDWFDSVVHQDVEHVETMSFLSANSRLETIYPHLEPLREWKIQFFPQGDSITIEIVTRESWLEEAHSLLSEMEDVMTKLVTKPREALFA
ncbi:putative d-alanine-poly ligase subunit 1 protein [Neofusicoccum parvum]|nr:putative d-alanine-poly ligase subunit 1 protein [Neofusicoccum parvum]